MTVILFLRFLTCMRKRENNVGLCKVQFYCPEKLIILVFVRFSFIAQLAYRLCAETLQWNFLGCYQSKRVSTLYDDKLVSALLFQSSVSDLDLFMPFSVTLTSFSQSQHCQAVLTEYFTFLSD